MSDKHVLCPWCGSEMKMFTCRSLYDDQWIGRYYCDNDACKAESPLTFGYATEEGAKVSAYAAAHRRYESPAKPLTWDELILHKNDAIYLEDFGAAEILVALLPEITPEYACFRDALRLFYAEKNDMNTRWRAWLRKPTEEERSAAKWEG